MSSLKELQDNLQKQIKQLEEKMEALNKLHFNSQQSEILLPVIDELLNSIEKATDKIEQAIKAGAPLPTLEQINASKKENYFPSEGIKPNPSKKESSDAPPDQSPAKPKLK